MPLQMPLIPSEPNYHFSIDLVSVTFIINIRWNERSESWYMDVSSEDEIPLLLGMRIVLGTLIGVRSTAVGRPDGQFIVSDLTDQGLDATLDDLGVRVLMYFYTTAELIAL